MFAGGEKLSRGLVQEQQEQARADRFDFAASEVDRVAADRLVSAGEKGAKRVARVKSHYSKAGLDVGAGVAKKVARMERETVQADILAMQNNMANKALQFRMDADQARAQSKIYRNAGILGAFLEFGKGAIALKGAQGSEKSTEFLRRQDIRAQSKEKGWTDSQRLKATIGLDPNKSYSKAKIDEAVAAYDKKWGGF